MTNTQSMFDMDNDSVMTLEEVEVETKSYLTKENLFNRAVKLNKDMLTIKADLKQLKADFTYDEDDNPKGLAKEDVTPIMQFAAMYANDNVQKVFDKAEEIAGLLAELMGDGKKED